jgi:uncharacterized protein YcbK (DUF882 family)
VTNWVAEASNKDRPVDGFPARTKKVNQLKRIVLQAIFVLSLLVCGRAMFAATNAPVASAPEYRLRMYHTHTQERIDIVYRIGDNYLPEALDKLNYFLRDHRTGDVKSYDPSEFDLLHDLLSSVGRSDGEIDIICGYRTPWSNEFLRSHSHGVALHSQHMQAKAIDIRVPGVSTTELRDAALNLHRGGVGFYSSSAFIHVDVGPVRRW